MVAKPIQLEEALVLALQLSPLDKVRLLERVALTLENDLSAGQDMPFETFKGALAHLGSAPTDEDIAEARRDMMNNFPREDFDL
jgi:hypothetical protein